MNRRVLIGVGIASVLIIILTFAASYFLTSKEVEANANMQNLNEVSTQESNVSTKSKKEVNYEILNNMKKKNSNMFNDMLDKQKESIVTTQIDDPVKELENKAKKLGSFWAWLVYQVQHISPNFITFMSIFGFAMAWLYRNSPIKSKGWLLFAIGAPLLFIFSIFGPAIYSSFQ